MEIKVSQKIPKDPPSLEEETQVDTVECLAVNLRSKVSLRL